MQENGLFWHHQNALKRHAVLMLKQLPEQSILSPSVVMFSDIADATRAVKLQSPSVGAATSHSSATCAEMGSSSVTGVVR